MSSTTPSTWPVGDSTGQWRRPRSNISSSTAPAGRSAAVVNAGADITWLTGASAEIPAATTFTRRSRSVTIPQPRSPRSTTTAVAP